MSKGFTLLEVMVTVVLIGIIAGFAVLSLRGADPADLLAAEARRLHALAELTQQEALLYGEQRGIDFEKTGYRFLTLDPEGEWLPPADTTLLKEHPLPPGVVLTLWVEDRPVDLAEAPQDEPQVLLLSSGEATDFQAIFSLEEERDVPPYGVSGDLTGHLETGPVQ